MSDTSDMPQDAFVLAIIGRPNVGKSTLFNRLVGRKYALVDDQPGVTRDRRFGAVSYDGAVFFVIDTPGITHEKSGTLAARMDAQTQIAVREADAVLLLVDARAGLLPEDGELARRLRKADTPIIVAANKCEGGQTAQEARELGLGAPIALSAEHGIGMDSLFERVRALMGTPPIAATDATPDEPVRLAVLGRPNAGKSTLINTLLGEERLLTGPEAGITRDAIAVDYLWDDQQFKIWDTAGVRRRARVSEKLEKLSVADALRAVKFAEIVVLLIDAQSPFDKQDIQLADLIEREGRALVIGINKCDMKIDRARLRQQIDDTLLRALPRLSGVPVVMLSGARGQGIAKLMQAIFAQYQIWNMRISTGRLNRWLAEATQAHPPPADRGRPVRLRYITQAKSRPPSFVAFSSRGHAVPQSYLRYLVNSLRATFDLSGVPIRFFMRTGDNPYIGAGKRRSS